MGVFQVKAIRLTVCKHQLDRPTVFIDFQDLNPKVLIRNNNNKLTFRAPCSCKIKTLPIHTMLSVALFFDFQMVKEHPHMTMNRTPLNQAVFFDSNEKRNFFADQKINPNFADEFSICHQGANTLNTKGVHK